MLVYLLLYYLSNICIIEYFKASKEKKRRTYLKLTKGLSEREFVILSLNFLMPGGKRLSGAGLFKYV